MHRCPLNAHESHFLDNQTHLRFRLETETDSQEKNKLASKTMGEEEGREGEDGTQNSLKTRFFKVNQNLLNLTPLCKNTPSGINTQQPFWSQLG